MRKVIISLQNGEHALLESPTGTGKTLCLLCAVLAWREAWVARQQLEQVINKTNIGEPKYKELLKAAQKLGASISKRLIAEDYAGDAPKIYYASRTHSQLKQVIKEVNGLSYRTKVGLLGSRDQLCINEQVRNANPTARTPLCRLKIKKNQCEFYTQRVLPKDTEYKAMDIEDMVELGVKHRACPYYLAREQRMEADVVILPYNYIVDKTARRAQQINLPGSIIIFDEAHNLESSCVDASSFDLTLEDLRGGVSEAELCCEIAPTVTDPGAMCDPKNFIFLKTILLGLIDAIATVQVKKETRDVVRPGSFIYELFRQCDITIMSVNKLTEILEEGLKLLVSERGRGEKKKSCLSTFQMAITAVFASNTEDDGKFFRVHIKDTSPATQAMINSPSNTGARGVQRTLSLWCFSSIPAMRDLVATGCRSVVLASGTLAPMWSFAAEMGMKFPHQLENPHVIDETQVLVGVVRQGPNGVKLNSSYQMRDLKEYKTELGNVIAEFACRVPDGLLVFFPSYAVMEDCIEFWGKPTPGAQFSKTIMNRICQLKEVVVEPRNKNSFKQVIEKYNAKVDEMTRGAILLAVCRGKVSEGIDFSDTRGRGVIITGLPFPSSKEPKIVLKQRFLDDFKTMADGRTTKYLSGKDWYQQQAARAVNQAIGRVIRHKNDFGAILLCDERFAQGSNLDQLSAWVKPHIRVHSSFESASSSVTEFFSSHETPTGVRRPAPSKESNSEVQTTSRLGAGSARPGASANRAMSIRRLKPPHPYKSFHEMFDGKHASAAQSAVQRTAAGPAGRAIKENSVFSKPVPPEPMTYAAIQEIERQKRQTFDEFGDSEERTR